MILDSDAEAATLVEASDTREAFKPVQRQQRVVGLDLDAAWYRTAKPLKALQRCEHVVVVDVPSLGEGLARVEVTGKGLHVYRRWGVLVCS